MSPSLPYPPAIHIIAFDGQQPPTPAETAGLPDDDAFRAAVREHLEFGARVAQQNSHAETDDQLHPIREVPAWTWPRQSETDAHPPT
jgi:hypothetical protein